MGSNDVNRFNIEEGEFTEQHYLSYDIDFVEFASEMKINYLKKYDDTGLDTPCWIYKNTPNLQVWVAIHYVGTKNKLI